MSVAKDGIHHRPFEPSPAGSRNQQEYGNNHETPSIINKGILDGTRRLSPQLAVLPNSATQNSNDDDAVVQEKRTDNAASQFDHTSNSTGIPSALLSSPSPNNSNKPQPKMRASHNVEVARLPSPSPAAIGPSHSGSQSPKHPRRQDTDTTTTTTIQDASPVLTPSNSSTLSTIPADDTPQPAKTRPKVTTPASPPPSPPSTTLDAGGRITIESPMGLQSTAPQSSNATPVRGGSLASIIHAAHREVDVPETILEKRENVGTPLSPTSMSHGTHSRKDSAATMVSASTSTGTAVDSPSKTTKDGGDAMEVDPPSQQPGSAGSSSNMPTGLGSKAQTVPLPYQPSRSPQPLSATQPQSHPSMAIPSTLGTHHRSQPSPSPPTPTPMSHPPKSPYPQSARPGTPTTAVGAPSHQRRHSLSRPHHSHSRSYSGRSTATMTSTNTTTITNTSTGVAPLQPLQTPQPRPLSPASQLPSFRRSDMSMAAPPSATPTTATADEREGEYIRLSAAEYDELQGRLAQLSAQNEDMRTAKDYALRSLQRMEQEVSVVERQRMALARSVAEWIRTGETLLRNFADAVSGPLPSAFNGRVHEAGEREAERDRARLSAAGVPLSSAMVGERPVSGREVFDRPEREKTLSVVMPGSPYTPAPHGRPLSGYGQESYPFRNVATPTHTEASAQLLRSAAHAPRPTHNANSHSHSLRRSRRPSSDDLATENPGGKRIKANNGTSIRTSPDAAERAHSYHHPGPSGLGRTSAMGTVRDGGGEIASYPTSHHRGSGSLGSGTEHGRDSPLNRRLLAGRDDDEDEFPSPRRSYAAPGVPSVTGNGNGVPTSAGRSIQARDPRVTALSAAAGDDIDAVGSPDGDTTVHESLMEMVDEDDTEAPRRGHGLRHVRGSVMRNGSRSSINSQDIDDMLAQFVDDESSRRGGNGSGRAPAKARHRAGPNPSGTGAGTSAFPIHLGSHSEAISPGQTRSYTPTSQATSSKFMSMSSVSPAPQPPNSRGFVFRNTDVADMEAQAQARSPEELGHRPSLSGSGSFNGAQASPPGTSGNPVTTQFLPPQSGPPQPKKVYHSKGTGQVIGSQHAAMMNPAPSAPVEAARPSQPTAATSTLTIDGLPKRTCKQCGQPGRYKDNKCVEKWGPGPQGPGTVCDRCRKKMKRVEKRATQDTAAMNAAMSHHQYPIAPAPSGSFSQLSNQGSQRFEESQEYGYSQATEDAQSQPSLSRSASYNHSSMLQGHGRRGTEQTMQRDATLPYPPHPSNSTREMPPPTSFTGTYGSPKAGRTNLRERSADTRDGDLDADGDAEMDELVDEDFGAAADASVAAANRRRDKAVKSEA